MPKSIKNLSKINPKIMVTVQDLVMLEGIVAAQDLDIVTVEDLVTDDDL